MDDYSITRVQNFTSALDELRSRFARIDKPILIAEKYLRKKADQCFAVIGQDYYCYTTRAFLPDVPRIMIVFRIDEAQRAVFLMRIEMLDDEV